MQTGVQWLTRKYDNYQARYVKGKNIMSIAAIIWIVIAAIFWIVSGLLSMDLQHRKGYTGGF